jgi:hypothetical protein
MANRGLAATEALRTTSDFCTSELMRDLSNLGEAVLGLHERRNLAMVVPFLKN